MGLARNRQGCRLRRSAAVLAPALILAVLPLQKWSSRPNFVGGFTLRRALLHLRAEDDGGASDAVFEDLFDEGFEAPSRGFGSSSTPRRTDAEVDWESFKARFKSSEDAEEDEADLGAEPEAEEATQEEEANAEEEELGIEVTDAEVDAFLAEFESNPIVEKQEGTVPLDPYSQDATKKVDLFRELRTNPSKTQLYKRGLPGERGYLTLKDRLTMIDQAAGEGDWKRARRGMKGIWRQKRLRLALGKVLWNLMIKAHANANRPKGAESWLVDMLNRIYQPDIISYNTLLNVLGRTGDFLGAEKWFRRMRARGVEPDMYSYGALANAYAKNRDVKNAERVVEELVNSGVELNPDNTMPHNCVLKLHAQKGMYQTAVDWFNRMVEDGIIPDASSYLQMIKTFVQAQDVDEAGNWLTMMMDAGITPKRQHFHALMTGYAKQGDTDGVAAWFRVMQDEGNRPDTCSYNIMMSAAAQAGSPDAALRILAGMDEVHVEPDLFTLSTLIGAYADAGNATEARFWLLKSEDYGLEPDLKCYNQAIKACARAGDSAMAEQLARRLLRYRLTPDAYTYNTLLRAFAQDGSWAQAEFWVDHLQRSARWRYNEFSQEQIGRAYTEVCLAHIRAGNVQASESWISQMLGEGIEPGRLCYTELADKYLELGQDQEAQKWSQRMNTWSNHRIPGKLHQTFGELTGSSSRRMLENRPVVLMPEEEEPEMEPAELPQLRGS